MTYSNLFGRLEPDGGERARFNYHLRSLRNANLLQLTDSLYGLTAGGAAALALLREVSERSEKRPRPEKESTVGERGWVRGVRDALRLRTAKANTIIPVGRVLLLFGSVILLLSIFLPWFTVSYGVSGLEVEWRVSSHNLLPGTLNGLRAFEAIGFFGGFWYAVAAFVWLLVVVALGISSAFVLRRFSWIGISGILVLVLSALQMLLVAEYRLRLTSSLGTTTSVALAYGFILAIVGSALIEMGARLKTLAPSGPPMQPTVSP